MRNLVNVTKTSLVCGLGIAALLVPAGCRGGDSGTAGNGDLPADEPLTEPALFLELPDICPTPDGMAMDRDGNIILACPNYGDLSKPAVFMKITPDNQLSLYATCPILEQTGRACPMGIDFGPDGSLYVCDNQGWPGTEEGRDQGRILRLKVAGGKVVEQEVVASGMSHPNGIKYRHGKLYVTQSLLPEIESEQLVSGLYRFDASDRNVKVANNASDQHLLARFKTLNMDCQYGLDGLVFDSKGNLFVGNFGDGTLHKITFDENGGVASSEVFAKSPHMRTTDGICVDEHDNIYVADFSANAVAIVSPQGEVRVLARSPDCDGSAGGLDQPGEPIVRGRELIVSNFDVVTGPDKVNTKHDKPYTLSVIDLGEIQ